MAVRKLFLALPLLVACQGGGPDGDGADAGTDAGTDGGTFVGQWPPGGPICATADPDLAVVAAVEPVQTTFEGFDTVYSIPEGARGLMFYFLGGNSVTEAVGPEQTAFAELLLQAGIGWVATSRTEPGDSKWNLQEPRVAQNEDLARLSRLRDFLLAEHGLPESTPIVSTGFSDGAAMSMFFAQVMADEGWPVQVVLPHNPGSRLSLSIPAFIQYSENDLSSVKGAAPAQYDEMQQAGVPSELRLAEERPVTAPSLRRVATWDDQKTQEVVADLVAYGLIDAAGNRLVTEDQIDGALRAWNSDTTINGSAFGEVRLRVLWATHRYTALHAADECQFVMDTLGF